MRDLSRGCDCGAGVGESEVRLGLGVTDSLHRQGGWNQLSNVSGVAKAVLNDSLI